MKKESKKKQINGMSRIIIILFLLLLVHYSGYSQSDSSIFSKSRILTSLFGSLTNQQVDIANGESTITTAYSIGTKSGVFVRNKWTMGASFSLTRSDFQSSNFKFDSENLVIGFWNRYTYLKYNRLRSTLN